MKAEPNEKVIWKLWLISTVVLIVFGVWQGVRTESTIRYYDLAEMKEMPEPTMWALKIGPYLWLVAIALGVGSGVLIALKGPSEFGMTALTLQWAIFTVCYVVVVHGLWLPFDILLEKIRG